MMMKTNSIKLYHLNLQAKKNINADISGNKTLLMTDCECHISGKWFASFAIADCEAFNRGKSLRFASFVDEAQKALLLRNPIYRVRSLRGFERDQHAA